MEIELKGISEHTYKVDFGTNAMCRVEDAFDPTGVKSCGDILDDLIRPNVRISEIRRLVKALLINPPNDLEAVGQIIDDIGGPSVFVVALRGSRALHGLPLADKDAPAADGQVAEAPATASTVN